MINLLLGLIILLAYLVLPTLPPASPTAPPSDTSSQHLAIQGSDGTSKTAVQQAFLNVPLLFIENQGQVDGTAAYYVKTPGQTLYFTGEGIVFDLIRYNETGQTEASPKKGDRLVFRLDFAGATEGVVAEGRHRDKAVVNYLTGSDHEKWHTDIPTYRELVYHDIYPNIDLRFYGKSGILEYEFVVGPGAAVSDIMLAFNGVDGLAVKDGELLITTAFGDLRQTRPYIYQQIGHEMVEVQGSFNLVGNDVYGFHVPNYDTDYSLVIDPSLVYSTYLGGSGTDYGRGIAVDASGCAYVTGHTSSGNTTFPLKYPFQCTYGGNIDAFVAKLNASGTDLVYSTYLGGSEGDYGEGIAVDAAGCSYVTGDTTSGNTTFPLKYPFQGTYGGNIDAFVAKLNASGTDLVYSTYLGGSRGDFGDGIAVDAAGCACVTGWTKSDNTTFPLKGPLQGTYGGFGDAFVAKLCEAAPPLPPPLPPSPPPPPLPSPPPSPGVSPVAPLPAPAVLALQYLKVHPEQAYAGQPVTITTNVVNTGGDTGNYNVVLRINGQAEQSRIVSVGPGGTYPVKFTVTRSQPGTYTVNVGGQQARFAILGAGGRSSTPPMSGGLIAILVMSVLVVVTAVMLALSFRRTI